MNTVIEIPVSTNARPKSIPTLTYAMDFSTMSIDGKADGIASLRQLIYKILLTERFAHIIYDDQFGCEIRSVVYARNVGSDFIDAELERVVRDALLSDERILSLKDFSYTVSHDEIYFKMTVETIFGKESIEINTKGEL